VLSDGARSRCRERRGEGRRRQSGRAPERSWRRGHVQRHVATRKMAPCSCSRRGEGASSGCRGGAASRALRACRRRTSRARWAARWSRHAPARTIRLMPRTGTSCIGTTTTWQDVRPSGSCGRRHRESRTDDELGRCVRSGCWAARDLPATNIVRSGRPEVRNRRDRLRADSLRHRELGFAGARR